MSIVEAQNTLVYFAPTARRRYFTRRAAIRAEARAQILQKYPTEKGGESDGYYYWHWTSDPRLVRVYARLVSRLSRWWRE